MPELAAHVRPAAGEPEGALVLMHGRGTSEQDLAPLLDVFDPGRRLVGLVPRGPLELPPGGRHWYVIRQLGFPDPETFAASFEALVTWLDRALAEHGVVIERTVLGGFSQGGVMAYALSLVAGRPRPAGNLEMSAFMPTVGGYELDLSDLEGFPVAIAHGTLDQIIPVQWGREAAERLGAAGAEVLYRESPVPHTLDPRELPIFTRWLHETLAPARPAT
jgi:phospholipase/carboxylesterase